MWKKMKEKDMEKRKGKDVEKRKGIFDSIEKHLICIQLYTLHSITNS